MYLSIKSKLYMQYIDIYLYTVYYGYTDHWLSDIPHFSDYYNQVFIWKCALISNCVMRFFTWYQYHIKKVRYNGTIREMYFNYQM